VDCNQLNDPSGCTKGSIQAREYIKSKRQKPSLVGNTSLYYERQRFTSLSTDSIEKTQIQRSLSPEAIHDDLAYSKEDTSFEDEKIISDSEESQQGDILGSPIRPEVADPTRSRLRYERTLQSLGLEDQGSSQLIAIKVNPQPQSLACLETFEEMNSPELPQEIEVHTPPTKVEQQQFAFSLLPDEILLVIFKWLPGPWKDLVRLRVVCKHWSVLLKDSSLKYGKLSEDLYVMVKNEKKHHGQIRDYLEPNTMRELTAEMRGILVDWLVEVAEEFRLQSETLFLTIHYIDRYLSLDIPITRGKLQLLGVTSLLIASKYEEIYVPTICDMVYIADNTNTKDEILWLELNLLNALKFDISVCTIRRFVEYFLKTAEDGVPALAEDKQRSNLENLASYIAELSLVDYRIAIRRPSLVGASVVCLALHALGMTWTYILENESHYSLDDLNGCVYDLWTLVNEASTSQLQAVYHKHAQKRFDCVSTLPIKPPCPLAPKINFIS